MGVIGTFGKRENESLHRTYGLDESPRRKRPSPPLGKGGDRGNGRQRTGKGGVCKGRELRFPKLPADVPSPCHSGAVKREKRKDFYNPSSVTAYAMCHLPLWEGNKNEGGFSLCLM